MKPKRRSCSRPPGSAGAVAAAITDVSGGNRAEAGPPAEGEAVKPGYRETDRIRQYYDTTRI